MEKNNKMEVAMEMCRGNDNNEYQQFSKIYAFTTENLTGWMPLFDFIDRSFLTVGSSCDQTINAAYLGSKKQTISDINPFVREYFQLKKSGLMTLTRSEFLNFFCSFYYKRVKNPDVFSKETFPKMAEFLKEHDYNSYLFWSEIFNRYNGDCIKARLFFSNEERCCPIIQKMNLYLNNDNSYSETREAIKKVDIDFIEGDIYQCNDWANYDNISLSNLGQYAANHEELIRYVNLVRSLAERLNVDGTMLIMYLFGKTKNNLSPLDDPNFISPIYDLLNTMKLFERYNCEIYAFPSVSEFVFGDTSSPDKAMIYRKKRKL